MLVYLPISLVDKFHFFHASNDYFKVFNFITNIEDYPLSSKLLLSKTLLAFSCENYCSLISEPKYLYSLLSSPLFTYRQRILIFLFFLDFSIRYNFSCFNWFSNIPFVSKLPTSNLIIKMFKAFCSLASRAVHTITIVKISAPSTTIFFCPFSHPINIHFYLVSCKVV